MAQKQLSINEIDDLMTIFKGGRRIVDRLGSVESLDLNNPARIPKGIYETLLVRHEQTAKGMVHSLRTILRTDLDINLVALEQDLFGTFKEGLEEPCCVFVYDVPPLRTPAYLVLDHGFVHACLDRLLGGPGRAEGTGRELTPTEVSVLLEVTQPVLAAHASVWQRYIAVQPRFQKTIAVPRFLRDVRANDPVLVADYAISGFADGTVMRFAMPLPGLDAHLQYARKEAPETSTEKKTQARFKVGNQMNSAAVGVSVHFGTAEIPVRDVLGLERGDVILLDKKVNEPLDLAIGGRPKFRGFLTRRGRDLWFRIAANESAKEGG